MNIAKQDVALALQVAEAKTKEYSVRFNRADVANYIERAAKSHQGELARLKNELTVCRAEKQKAESEARLLAARLEEMTGGEPVREAVPEDPEALELAAYRRAEAAERSANQRIRRQMERLGELMDGISAEYASAGEEMKALLCTMTEDMENLQALFGRLEQSFSKTEADMEELENEIGE